MREDTKKLFNVFYLQHKLLLQELVKWSEQEKGNYDCFELTDASYALREMIKLHEDLLKDLKKQERMAHAKCGIIYLQSDSKDPIKTEYCSAEVEITELPEIPKRHKDPERYDAFMKYLGIPEELSAVDMVRLHWPSFIEWYNKRLEDAKPAPPGVDVSKTTTTARLSIRKKKNIEFIRGE